jgi:hypothetical protein
VPTHNKFGIPVALSLSVNGTQTSGGRYAIDDSVRYELWLARG